MTSTGLLNDAQFIPGVPDEFAASILQGAARKADATFGGEIKIDHGGYDAIESSPYIFERAAELLVIVLVEFARTTATEDRVRRVVTEAVIGRGRSS